MKKWLRLGGIVAAGVALLIQLIRPEKSNPTVDPSIAISAQAELTPRVSALIRTSCFDCHSNETRWPWYSYVAPVSWLIADDVQTGRRHLNFSDWGKYTRSKREMKLSQIYEQVSRGEMPLSQYLLMHADAKLTAADKDTIINWTERERDKLTDEVK